MVMEHTTQSWFVAVTGLFLSKKNRIGQGIDLLAQVLREASRDGWLKRK